MHADQNGLPHELYEDTATFATAPSVFRPMGRLRQAIGKQPAKRKKAKRKAKRRR